MSEYQSGEPISLNIGPYQFPSIKAAARFFGVGDTTLAKCRREGRAEHHVIRVLLKRHWYKPERHADDLQVVSEIVQHMAKREA